jgi:DNA polymerase III delta prime subunit
MPFHHATEMLRDRETTNRLQSTLRSGSSRLIKDKLIAPSTEDNAIERNGFALAENGRQEFRPVVLRPKEIPTENPYNLIAPETIVKRTLYYNAGTAHQVEELALLLGEKKMQSVLRRLRRSGLRCGFTCLFHGGPGTGKTETVMQLARRSGRAVWQVDYSQLRNKWVGDSEKSVKAEFDGYRALLSKGGPAPILLLNEADALIGKRLESPERAVDKMENAIQNIVLQEMETFEGILIATTNFTTVLDKAFERRFLYKVEFEAPDADTRSKIWRSLMPTLDSGEAFDLAEQFPAFAGGQIENITRKATVRRVLHGRNAGWDELLEMCGQEMLDSRTGHQIGFRPQAR